MNQNKYESYFALDSNFHQSIQDHESRADRDIHKNRVVTLYGESADNSELKIEFLKSYSGNAWCNSKGTLRVLGQIKILSL